MIYTANKTIQEVITELGEVMSLQGCQSLDALGDECIYLNPEGHRCPVGHLIEKQLITPNIEGCSVSTLIFNKVYLGINYNFIHKHGKILSMLQKIHDIADTPPENVFISELKEQGYNLDSWKGFFKAMSKPKETTSV
jgi:hypothetical protein